MTSNFSNIPVLDYSLVANSDRKPDFIRQLQHALINVGFLYISNTPVAREDIDAVIDYAPLFFNLPQEEKEKLQMANSQHFFGYSRFGAEITKGKTDQREQFDFGTPHQNRWRPGDPEHLKLWGPSQWPDENVLPGFKTTFQRYVKQVEALGYELLTLFAEALQLPPDTFIEFFRDGPGEPIVAQHRGKVVKYPARSPLSSDQGVGPHFDGGFLTLLLQASPHRGLQVQNIAGEWIDAPPIPGTFVVNIGKALETITQGVALATSHRVLSPPEGSTPRYSIPFFQITAQTICLGDRIVRLSPEVLKLKEQRGTEGAPESVNYAEYNHLPAGEVALIGRVKSHPDVAERHYPTLFRRYFPNGLPAQGSAY